jgi:hypothetical protein
MSIGEQDGAGFETLALNLGPRGHNKLGAALDNSALILYILSIQK